MAWRCGVVALLPPARPVVPAGTREHSLALFSELWEAGCHHGSQELEVCPGVGEGRQMSEPSSPGARFCQATGVPQHKVQVGVPLGGGLGLGGGGGGTVRRSAG